MRELGSGPETHDPTFVNLVDRIPDCLIVHRKGVVLQINEAVRKRLGYDDGDLIGKSMLQYVPRNAHRSRILEDMGAEVADDEGMGYDIQVVDKRGGIHTMIVRSMGCTHDGEPASQIVLIDVTERRLMEEELLRARKLESIGVLAGGIAHDFNNILTGIIAGISLAKRQLSPESEAFNLLADSEQACFKAADLTRRLLTFSRGGTPVRSPLCLRRTIRDTVRFTLRNSNVDCSLELSDTLLPAVVDEGQIVQVLGNLLTNADQAMAGSGKILIRAENVRIGIARNAPSEAVEIKSAENLPLDDGLYICITVTDTGPGIPPEDLQRIFDPYFTTKIGGTGLGLAMVHSIVQKHNGHLTVHSQVGRGTTFSLYLPAALDTGGKTRGGSVPADSPSTRRILIMDDDAVIRKMLTKLLTQVGYAVETVQDGAQAVDAYRLGLRCSAPYAIVLLDLIVPGKMGGREAAEKLKEIDPGVKIVFFSGYSHEQLPDDTRNPSFSGFIKKPFDIERLTELLEKVIGKAAGV